VPCDSKGEGYEKSLNANIVRDEHCAVKKRDPNHSDGNDLHAQRYGLVLAETADVRAESLMIH
jgi:hypothetical protein